MNPAQNVFPVLQRVGCLLILTWSLGTSLPAAPVALPDWVKPIESTLPKLPPEIISEVDEIRKFSLENREKGYLPEVISQRLLNSQRLVDLQEQAGQAMIWQYLKATGGRYMNTQILARLASDRELAAWILPIIRFRIEWLKNALNDPGKAKYLQKVFSSFELFDLHDYIFQQGEFYDIENLAILENNAIRQKFKFLSGAQHEISIQERLQGMVKTMQEVRSRNGQRDEPYWQRVARYAVSEENPDKDPMKPRSSGKIPIDESNRPKPLGPRQPLPEIKTPQPFLQPWMVWPMWLFIFLVSAGLLRWLFRRPKRSPIDGEPVGAGRGL